jgi:hypothetical protein
MPRRRGVGRAAPTPRHAAATGAQMPTSGRYRRRSRCQAGRLADTSIVAPSTTAARRYFGVTFRLRQLSVMLSTDGVAVRQPGRPAGHRRIRPLTSSYGASWAIGTDVTGDPHILQGTGGIWRDVPFPGNTTAGLMLTAIAAAAGVNPWVAETGPNGPVLLHWTGSRWASQAAPPGDTSLSTLTVHTATDVWAAAGPDDVWVSGGVWPFPPFLGELPAPLLAHWNGTSWTQASLPLTLGFRRRKPWQLALRPTCRALTNRSSRKPTAANPAVAWPATGRSVQGEYFDLSVPPDPQEAS